MTVDPLDNLFPSPDQGTVELPRGHFRDMVHVVRLLFRISRNPHYRDLILSSVPAGAGFDPGHDAVMMGFDFHLTLDGPKLIEVNTNAGGGLLALQASGGPEGAPLRRLKERLRRSFHEEWARFSPKGSAFPRTVLIFDEKPAAQFLYPEMLAFADLFREWGATVFIAGPEEVVGGSGGVFLDGEKIDFIYNRHCDFYLEGASVEGIRKAYQSGAVCLSPNPFTYGLLADKRRFLLWSRPDILDTFGLAERDRKRLSASTPESHLMADMDPQQLWREREKWVFKPITGFGSRGVILGRSMSRTRLATLEPGGILVQRFIPPSKTITTGNRLGRRMKTDFRLFAYRNRLLGVAARVYQGQVTNLRSPGAGFATVKLI